jgi:hypothetical protein
MSSASHVRTHVPPLLQDEESFSIQTRQNTSLLEKMRLRSKFILLHLSKNALIPLYKGGKHGLVVVSEHSTDRSYILKNFVFTSRLLKMLVFHPRKC